LIEMVDLHSHVLPGIDDGARNLEESRAMCAAAAAEGCAVVVATPHQRTESWPNENRAALESLHAEVVASVGVPPRLLLGAEIRIDAEFLNDLDHVPESELVPLAGGHHLLLEFDPSPRVVPDPVDLVHELVVAGWRPIFAHPEMYPWLADNLPLVRHLVAKGARFQVTAMSVTGDFGRGPRETCARLLDLGLVHFVASDTHDTVRRPPGLRRAYQAIAQGWGEATARALTIHNPRAVVEDRAVPAYVGAE
jgi:protein-tyrosine phosphatase